MSARSKRLAVGVLLGFCIGLTCGALLDLGAAVTPSPGPGAHAERTAASVSASGRGADEGAPQAAVAGAAPVGSRAEGAVAEPGASGAVTRVRRGNRSRSRPTDVTDGPEEDVASVPVPISPISPDGEIEVSFTGGKGRVVFLNGGSFTIGSPRRARPAGQRLDAEWSRAVEQERALPRGSESPADRVQRLLTSENGDDVAAGIAAAATARPPLREELLRVADDPSQGTYRALALLGIGRAGISDDEAFEVVRRAARDDAVDVRVAAVGALSAFGKRGVDLAQELLREGGYADEVALRLAQLVEAGGVAIDFLRTSPPPPAAIAVLGALGAMGSRTPEERALLARELPPLVRPLLASPALQDDSQTMLALLDAVGAFPLLTEIATRQDLAFSLREAATAMGLHNTNGRAGDDRERSIAPAVALLRDAATPVKLLRNVIASIPDEAVELGPLLGALVALEASHANAWVRADALELLSATGHAPAGDLRILSAIYGKDGGDVDVADALRAAVAGGRLRVLASNELAGDPIVGVRKILRVEYVHAGRRLVREVWEGAELILP